MDRYVEGLGEWTRGNEYWHFESQRYFGKEGLRMQKEREVLVLPPRVGGESESESIEKGSMMSRRCRRGWRGRGSSRRG